MAQASGARSTTILRHALQALARVAHRGAVATDHSGDGAGVLTQIPVALFQRDAARLQLRLAPGQEWTTPVFAGLYTVDAHEHTQLRDVTASIEFNSRVVSRYRSYGFGSAEDTLGGEMPSSGRLPVARSGYRLAAAYQVRLHPDVRPSATVANEERTAERRSGDSA